MEAVQLSQEQAWSPFWASTEYYTLLESTMAYSVMLEMDTGTIDYNFKMVKK